MTIHFICTGNIYRSRLAEAYCASKGVPGLRVSATAARGRPSQLLAASHEALEGIERFLKYLRVP